MTGKPNRRVRRGAGLPVALPAAIDPLFKPPALPGDACGRTVQCPPSPRGAGGLKNRAAESPRGAGGLKTNGHWAHLQHARHGPTLRLPRVLLAAILVASAALGAAGCRDSGHDDDRVRVFAAANLARPMSALADAFEAEHPGTKVECEFGGSLMICRQIAELGRSADLVAVADYLAVEQILMPRHASWYVNFAGNELGIAFTQASKYGAEISADNWFEVLARPDVRIGRVDENTGPIGYWTLQCWLLADDYYAVRLAGGRISDRLTARCGPNDILPDINDFLPRLESATIDYVFMHRSLAQQHNLRFVALPDAINLSRMALRDAYAKVSVPIRGKARGERIVQVAHPIVYAVTIPTEAANPALAEEFLRFMLSERGRAIMAAEHQTSLVPPQAVHAGRMPATLQALFQEATP